MRDQRSFLKGISYFPEPQKEVLTDSGSGVGWGRGPEEVAEERGAEGGRRESLLGIASVFIC